MRRHQIIAFIVGSILLGVVTSAFGDELPVLIKEVMSREFTMQVGGIAPEGIKEVFSREVSFQVNNGAEDGPSLAISREISIAIPSNAPPAPVTEFNVSVSPTGSSVTLDWNTYNQWAELDIDHFEIYYTTEGPFNIVPAAGLQMIRVPAGSTSATIADLPEFTDHCFAVVAVDALGNFNPDVTSSCGYVLSPEVVSREVSFFVSNGPLEPPYPQAASREVSLLVVSDPPPTPIPDLEVSASPANDSITLDWSEYNQWAELDLAGFDVYYTNAGHFDTVSGDGLSVISVQAGSTSVTLNDLTPFADHFFAVVPVDAGGNFNTEVISFGAYVYPQSISHELSLFVGQVPDFDQSQVISREVSILTPGPEVPEPITDFTVDTSITAFSAVDVDWTSYNEPAQMDVVRYNFYFADAYFNSVAGMTPFASILAGTQQYTLTGLPCNQIFFFAVVAEDVLGNFNPEVQSTIAQASTCGVDEVENLAVESFADSLIFSWHAPDDAGQFLDHYNLYFAGAATPLELSADATTWQATGLAPATSYPLRITTVDIFGKESPGTSINGITLLENPANVQMDAYDGRVTVNWEPVMPSGLVNAYHLYLSETPFTSVADMTPNRVAGPDQTSIKITGLTNGITYYAAVTAVNLSGGEDKAVTPVSATPVADVFGPEISNITLNGTPVSQDVVFGSTTIISVEASDPSGVSRISFFIDGELRYIDTSADPAYSFPWDVALDADGVHELRIVAYDTRNNQTEVTYQLTVALNVPDAPVITAPLNGTTTNLEVIRVSGTSEQHTEVIIYNNGVPAGGWTPVDAYNQFSIPLNLSGGENNIQAVARHPGRTGQSVPSNTVQVIMDSSIPKSPTHLTAQAGEAGTIRLSWSWLVDDQIKGFNLYRAANEFASTAGAQRINTDLISGTTYLDLPGQDQTYYYSVTAVSMADVESPLSSLSSATADSVLPRAVSIQYTPTSSPYDPDTGRMGPGMVNVAVTVSEPLLTIPFLSINPVGAVPITVDLFKQSDLEYSGMFSISDTTPAGTAHAVFSARDVVGNRGTEIGQGGSISIDTAGPSVIGLDLVPGEPIQNDNASPASVQAVIGLDEAVKPGETPVIYYTLSGHSGDTYAFDSLTQVATLNGHAQTWQADFVLPADAGLDDAETLQFAFSAPDDLDNIGIKITCDNQFQVYQGDLPPLSAPTGLNGQSLPAGEIALSWNPVEGASGYNVYRQAPGETELYLLARVDQGLTYTDQPGPDGDYIYAVSSLRNENEQEAESGLSEPVTVSSDSVAPAPPINLGLELIPQGIRAQWEANGYVQEVTYRLYRANLDEITSVEGMTPILTDIADITVVDAAPSLSDHCYAVTAVDPAGNESAPSISFYLNFDLLPVTTLSVTRQDDDLPVVSWSHSGSTISGYDIYLGPEESLVKLNGSGQLNQTTYTDTGFDGNTRRYTVIAIDENGIESLGRSIELPNIEAAPVSDSRLLRGVMNRLEYEVVNGGTETVEGLQLTAQIGEHVFSSQTFSLDAGSSTVVTVVVAGHDDLPDLADLKTTINQSPNAGETIEIIKNSEISVGTGMMQLTLTNDEFLRGGSGSVTFSLENTGAEEIEIITAEAGEKPSSEITLFILDREGNVLSSTSYFQQLGENVLQLFSGRTAARIQPGASFVSNPMAIDVPSSAPDNIEIVLEITNLYYHSGQPDEIVMAGMEISREITLIDTTYKGSISQVFPQQASDGQDITITGKALERNSGAALAEVPLILVIGHDGFEQVFDVFSGSDGTFSYIYTPSAGASGIFKVCAVHPDLNDRPVQAQFVISSISTNLDTINLSIPRNYEQEITLKVTSGEGTQVNNLRFVYDADDQPSGQFPAGIDVDTGDVIPVLESGSSVSMSFSVVADNTCDDTGQMVIKLVSDESGDSPWQTITINIQFSDVGPVLAYAPGYIETGLALDETAIDAISLENTGLAALRDIEIFLVNQDGSQGPSWIKLNSDTQIAEIEVGQTHEISLAFAPTADQASEGLHTFYLKVNSANYQEVTIPVYVSITQSGLGNALFKISDIYTATIDPDTGELIQGLEGANVKLQNEKVLTEEYSGVSDDIGEVFLQDIIAGVYKYRVTASNHQEVTGRIWIKPGITKTEDIFLGYNLVTVEWEVVETTIEDKYEIVLNAVFETDVPAAVVIAEPKAINLPTMSPGDVFTGEIRYTNYGLIRAEDLSFNLPESDQYFKYEFLVSLPETLEAKESFILPYKVTCLRSLTGEDDGTGGGCVSYSVGNCLWYIYKCSNGATYEGIECTTFAYISGDCGGNSTNSGIGSIGFASYGVGGYGAGYSPGGQIPEGIVCGPKIYCEVFDECCKARAREAVGSYVDRLRGSYEDSAVDFFLKVPGDNFQIARWYYGGAWHFENAVQRLNVEMNLQGTGIESIEKDGVDYEKADADGLVFVFNTNKYIYVQENGELHWKDSIGNWKKYDAAGKILSKGFRETLQLKYLYDTGDPDRLNAVLDANDDSVVQYQYDAAGHIISVKDNNGRQVVYDYQDNRLVKVTDTLNNDTLYSYNSEGLLETKTDPEGRVTTLVYNDFGWVEAVIDENGARTEFKYAQNEATNERYSMIVYPTGKVLETWYDGEGRIVREDLNGKTTVVNFYENRKKISTDASGNKTIYEFDEWNHLVKKTYPDGTTEESEYDSETKLNTWNKDRNGTETRYAYNDSGYMIRKTVAQGTASETVTEMTYDDDGNRLTIKILGDDVTDENLTEMEYDEYGNMTASTDPEGNRTTYTYNYMGLQLTKTDPRNNTWEYEYDASGNVIKEIDPLGKEIRYEYDKVGNLIRHTDKMEREFTYEFDGKDQLISSSNPLGDKTEYTLDFDGKTLRKTDPEGKSLSYEYDMDGRLVKKMNSAGKTVLYEYDDANAGCSSCSGSASGNPSLIQYPHLGIEQTFDTMGRKIKTTLRETESGDAFEMESVYDDNDDPIVETDLNGRSTLTEYDELARKTRETLADGSEIEYAYDNRNNLIRVQDGNGHATRFEYDGNDRLVKEIRPLGQETSYAYDGNGNLIEKTDAENRTTKYIFDEVSRLEEIRFYDAGSQDPPVKTVSFTYNDIGKITGYTDGTVSGTFDYDAAYRKVSETIDYGSFAVTYRYTYYKNGLKKNFTGPDNITYEYTYTDDNRIAGISIPGHGFVTYGEYEWSKPGQVSFPGGSTLSYTYDPMNRTRSVKGQSPGDQIIFEHLYEYDNEKNITRLISGSVENTFGYDDAYRLTSVTRSQSGTESFEYDSAGNRLRQGSIPGSWNYNGNDQLTGYDDAVFTYDDNGNTISVSRGTDTLNYMFDHNNRLVRVEDGAGTVLASYYYDPFGKRLWKEVGGQRTYFVYADEGLVAEYNSAGQLIKSYGYQPGSSASTQPVFLRIGNDYYFYQNDYMRKPVKAISKNGAVVWSAEYDAFGHALVEPGSVVASNLRAPGQYYDEETGFHYNMFRYYDPTIGRYLNPDPIGMGNRPDMARYLDSKVCGGIYTDIDINYYVYADANPINKVDPNGTLGVGISGATGCWPVLMGAGVKAKGKMIREECCDCDTNQMSVMTTVEACVAGCIGFSAPSIKPYISFGGGKCCPRKTKIEGKLEAGCSAGTYKCGVSLTVPPFPPKFSKQCGFQSLELDMEDGVNIGASCEAGGCVSVAF